MPKDCMTYTSAPYSLKLLTISNAAEQQILRTGFRSGGLILQNRKVAYPACNTNWLHVEIIFKEWKVIQKNSFITVQKKV